jgi:hypothetical protein
MELGHFRWPDLRRGPKNYKLFLFNSPTGNSRGNSPEPFESIPLFAISALLSPVDAHAKLRVEAWSVP